MAMNRELQHQVLLELRDRYPESTIISELFLSESQNNRQELAAVTCYLTEHGLISDESGAVPTPSWYLIELPMKITARGLDFLEQDGGLSAILGTVTVKLHADTIRDMLEAKIMDSPLTQADKKRFVDTLKELPGEALKTFTNKLVELACENPQAVFTTLQNIAN